MELLEGHLRVHLDLGTGPVNVRASRLPLNDGQWHHVELNLKRSMGRVAVDGQDESFETPGKSMPISSCHVIRIREITPFIKHELTGSYVYSAEKKSLYVVAIMLQAS